MVNRNKLWSSAEDEFQFKSLIAWGNKLLCNLVVQKLLSPPRRQLGEQATAGVLSHVYINVLYNYISLGCHLSA